MLRARGPRTVIATLGPRGAMVVGAEGRTLVAGVPVTAVDTSGAGDAFCGALVTYLADGELDG